MNIYNLEIQLLYLLVIKVFILMNQIHFVANFVILNLELIKSFAKESVAQKLTVVKDHLIMVTVKLIINIKHVKQILFSKFLN